MVLQVVLFYLELELRLGKCAESTLVVDVLIRYKVSHIGCWKGSLVIYKIDKHLHLAPISFRLEAHLA